MRVIVDRERCESHGQCALAAPNVFELDDELDLHVDEHPPDAERAGVEEAVRMCPMQAIDLEG